MTTPDGTGSDGTLRIDAYAHVGMPRFQTVDDYRAVMADGGIDRAVLSLFDACPDVEGAHAALCRRPDTFRALGVPLGADESELRAGAEAQLAAGFSGLRLSDADVLERSWLLETLAERERMGVVCGRASAPECAEILVAHLERHPEAVLVGGHFGGADDPRVLERGPVAELFAHPRFFVVFSRHGGYPTPVVRHWAEAVVARCGWQRILWGSEAPVLFWRDETIQQAVAWVDQLRPTADERAAFFGGNARRLYFGAPAPLGPLRMPFDPWARATPRPLPAGAAARQAPGRRTDPRP